ncbi:methyltransferase domain-containing protein [Colletotrichum tofieldiae]|nr:methyltransferase domain-containing protein [Colletotrichum tofieldiae]
MTDSSQNPPVPALALRSETASPVGEPSTGLNVAPEAVTNVESEVGPDALEVDDAASLNEAASNIDDQISTYTASLSSSVLDYPTENGRRYHAFRAGCGWVEFQDYDISFHSDDGSLTDKHHTDKWSKLLLQACEMAGRDPCPGPKLEGWVKSTGFTDVVHQQFKIPVGPWPKDPHYRDIGMTNLIQLLDGLEGFSLRTFCGIHGWTKEEVFVMLAHVRKELKTVGFHAYSAM